MNTPNDPQSPITLATIIKQGLGVRLRFFLVIGGLACLMALWPTIRLWSDRVLFRGFSRSSNVTPVSSDTEFFCPMDPGVVSAWPAICPICNMDLITRSKSDATMLPEGVLARMQITPYRIQLAGVRTALVQVQSVDSPPNSTPTLWVPHTAILHRGGQAIVYVENMPGMLDAVPVQLGARDRDLVRIVDGLTSEQRVVIQGAFLVDAESRLNPNLSTQYFGASGSLAKEEPPKAIRAGQAKDAIDQAASLSREDQAIVELQRICPVTQQPLGSMGTPILVEVAGRRVAICCIGCKGRLTKSPEKYLARLDGNPAEPTVTPSQAP